MGHPILILGATVGVVVLASYCYQEFNRRNGSQKSVRRPSPKTRTTSSTTSPATRTSSNPVSSSSDAGKKWFYGQMDSFSHDMLAYYISKAAKKKGLTAKKTMALYDKYGLIPLKPSLKGFEAGFMEAGLTLSTLSAVACEWLKDNNIEANANDWEAKITQYLETRQMEAAAKIVEAAYNESKA